VAEHTVVLIRHAKSGDGPVDVERTLAPRGIRDSRAIGEWLASAGIRPDLVVVSPARRARETWSGAAARLAGVPGPVVDDRIYANDVAALIDVIHETPEDVGTLALVGHNPSFGDLAYQLDDGIGDHDARQELAAGFPTSAVAVYDVATGWADVELHGATLRAVAAPRG
jgi:phosphohistidine phosphatase